MNKKKASTNKRRFTTNLTNLTNEEEEELPRTLRTFTNEEEEGLPRTSRTFTNEEIYVFKCSCRWCGSW